MSVSKFARFAQVFALLLLAVLVYFWSYVENLVPGIKLNQLGSIAIAILAIVVSYFDSRFDELLARPRGTITSGSLGECIDRVLRTNGHFRSLSVYAASSEMIQPLIAARGVHIKNCKLLVRVYPSQDQVPERSRYNDRVRQIVSEWRQMCSDGHIESLVVKTTPFAPSTYQVFFDEKALLIGAFYRRDDVPAEVEYMPPFLIEDTSKEGNAFIKNFYSAFERSFSASAPYEG